MSTITFVQNKVRTYPRLIWLLGCGLFFNLVGLSFLWPVTTIYIHDQLGRPLTVAGVVLFFHSGAAALGNLTGGYLFDRLGGRRVLLLGLLSSAGFLSLLFFFESWPLFVTVMILYGFATALVFPTVYALAAKAWPEGGRRAFNFLYVANNMGVAVGTALGGILAERSFKLAFLGAAVMILVFAIFAFVYIHDGAGTRAQGSMAKAPEAVDSPIPWAPIVALFVGFLTLWLIYVQWQATLSVYMRGIGIPLSGYSLLWTLNGLVIVLGQPLLAVILRYVRSTPAQLLLGTGLFLASYGLLLTSQAYGFFVGAMVVLTLGEMLLWPGVPAAVERLAPPSRRGFLQGFISSAATFGRMVGPLVGGLLYDHWGYHWVLVTMVGLVAVPVLCILIYTRTVRVSAKGVSG